MIRVPIWWYVTTTTFAMAGVWAGSFLLFRVLARWRSRILDHDPRRDPGDGPVATVLLAVIIIGSGVALAAGRYYLAVILGLMHLGTAALRSTPPPWIWWRARR